jgi:O-antigen ligase
MLAAMLMVTLQQPLLAILAMFGAVGALALVLFPELLIPVAVFMLYSNAAVIAVHFHGAPAAFGLAPLLLLAVPAVHDVVLRRQKIIVTSTLMLLFCFLIIQLMGAFFSTRPDKALEDVMGWVIEGLILYLLVTNAIRSKKALRTAIWGVMLAGAFVGTISVYQQLTGSFDNEFGGFAQVSTAATFGAEGDGEGQPRLSGHVGEKNRYAQVMGMVLVLALFQYGSERARSLRVVAVACAILAASGFALAFSRGALVGLALTFMVLFAMGAIRLRILLLLVPVVIATGLVAPKYADRIESLAEVASSAIRGGVAGLESTDGATRGRLTEMTAAVYAFADHPVIGVGPGMYRSHYRHYAEVVGGRIATTRRQAHSMYVGLAADHGLLGLLLMAAMLFATFRGLNRARRRWRVGQPDLRMMATGLEAALIVYLTTSIFLHFAYIR